MHEQTISKELHSKYLQEPHRKAGNMLAHTHSGVYRKVSARLDRESFSGSLSLKLSPTETEEKVPSWGKWAGQKTLKPSRTQSVWQQAGDRPAGPCRIKKKALGHIQIPVWSVAPSQAIWPAHPQVRSPKWEPQAGEHRPRATETTSQETFSLSVIYQQLSQGKEVA